jgi:hypothetical protein
VNGRLNPSQRFGKAGSLKPALPVHVALSVNSGKAVAAQVSASSSHLSMLPVTVCPTYNGGCTKRPFSTNPYVSCVPAPNKQQRVAPYQVQHEYAWN